MPRGCEQVLWRPLVRAKWADERGRTNTNRPSLMRFCTVRVVSGHAAQVPVHVQAGQGETLLVLYLVHVQAGHAMRNIACLVFSPAAEMLRAWD